MLLILNEKHFFLTNLKPKVMHGNSMNVSVRNNLKLLRKRDKFKYFNGTSITSKKTEYNLPKASLKQLRVIKKRLQSEYKIRMVKVVVLTLIILLALVLFVFLNFDNVSYYLRY